MAYAEADGEVIGWTMLNQHTGAQNSKICLNWCFPFPPPYCLSEIQAVLKDWCELDKINIV